MPQPARQERGHSKAHSDPLPAIAGSPRRSRQRAPMPQPAPTGPAQRRARLADPSERSRCSTTRFLAALHKFILEGASSGVKAFMLCRGPEGCNVAGLQRRAKHAFVIPGAVLLKRHSARVREPDSTLRTRAIPDRRSSSAARRVARARRSCVQPLLGLDVIVLHALLLTTHLGQRRVA